MSNELDFINSIGTIGFSSLKDRFALLRRDSQEEKFLLNVINAKPDRLYLISKGDDFFTVRLQNLAVKHNRSLKEGEESLELKKDLLSPKTSALFRRTFGKKAPVIISLPKRNYVEVRLLCGATLAQIKNEVANDKYHLDRINGFIDQWQLMRMFPPKVGKEALYKGFRIISRENAKRGLHNAVVDGHGRTIAVIEEVEQPEDSYRNAYAISYILPSRQSEAQILLREIGTVVGRQEEIDFDDLKRWSDHINSNITDDAILFMTYATPSDRFINTGFRTGADNPDSVVTDNSSSPYDDELTVRANDGPFEADPVTITPMVEPMAPVRPTLKPAPSSNNPSQLLLQFAEEGEDDNKKNNNLKNNDHGRTEDNGTEIQDIRPGTGQGNGRHQHDNEGGERKPRNTGADRGEPDMVPSPQATESYARPSEKGDDGDNGALSEGPLRVGRGGGRTTPSDGGGVHSGQGGTHPGRGRDDVHSLGGTPSGTDEDIRPAVVRGGVEDLPAPADGNGEVDARIPGGVDRQGDGDRTRQDVVEDAAAPSERIIFNEDAYIDSEHDVQVPKAGTLAAYKANVKAIATLADIIGRGDFKLKADINDYPNAEQLRQDLNTTYDSFVFKYGSLNEDRVRRRLQDDKPDFIKMLALENCKKRENLTGSPRKQELIITKSDIFRHRTINRAPSDIDSDDPTDLVFHSFATKGKIDTAFLRERLGEDWLEKCDGLIFKNPETEQYELFNIYLSGHIGDKLEDARLAAMGDDTYNKNVEALEKVLPKRIGIDEIIINMGTDIVPVAAYQNFIMTELMNVTSQSELRKMKCDISYNENHSWNVSFTQKEQNLLRSYDVRRPDCTARKIIDAAFNDTHIKVTDKDENGTPFVNESLTLIANTKVREIRESFETWVHTKAPQAYMDDIEDVFNRRFNQYVATNWDNMRVSLEGCTKTPREHQKNVVARGLTNNDMLMHHAVGAGKTLAMGMTMMERIRLGIATKCCLLTMKANASQIAGEIQNAYPNAKILYPSEKDFDKENRNIFLNRIKHSDADIVILTHDQFNKIKHEDRFREMFVAWQIETIRELRSREETEGLSPADRKRLDKMEENLRNELENENEKLSKDEISWTELGFDNLAVDEAHLFKNLLFQTSHDKVKGINADSNSKRASHLFMAVRDIQEKNGGDKGVIFATGTPISNSLAELYNWQVYLVPNILKKQGINCFDKWADVFAQRQSDWEPDELGRSKLVERFRSFINLQPLLTSYRGFADVITEKDLIEKKLVADKPKALYRQVIVPFDSKVDAAIFEELKNIMDTGQSDVLDVHLTEKSFSARSLVTLSKGTKASLTHKMLGLDDEEFGTIHNKVDYVAKNVARIYKDTQFAKGTQLIFSDSYQNGDYNLYTDIKRILSQRYGIPAKEIVDINTVKEKDRASFFERVNDGDVRVVLGSTQKLGTGVNVQKRACAAHMLDVNWTPSGMIQKTGRVARQGNEFAKQFLDNNVPVYLYVKERSTDAKKYGLIFAKQRMIEQITDSNFVGNRFDEGKSDTELESEIFQELLASATGDNTTMVLNKLVKQYQMLVSERKGFESYKYNISRNLQLAQMAREEYANQKYVIDRLVRTLSDKELKDEDIMIRGRFKVVNSFDRIVKTKQNLDEVPAIRYDNKDMGDCITNSREVNIRKKDGTSFKKEVEDIYVTLSSKALKELPEADAFGNVKLAICTKRTDEKFLTANKLQLNEQGQLVNEQGRRVPNLMLVADPKTYKNGQPYANTVRVLTVRKEDLAKLPTLDDKNGTIALRIDGLTNKVALNVNKYVTENRTQEVEKYLQGQSGDKNAKIDPKRPYDTNVTISAVSEYYSSKYAMMEVSSWEKITPKVDLETYKNAPSQFDIFREVVSDYMEKKAKSIKESASKNVPEEDTQEETQKQGRKI